MPVESLHAYPYRTTTLKSQHLQAGKTPTWIALSKTKCIAWLRKPKTLPSFVLCGNQLPWVERVIHLGVTLTNNSNPIEVDMDIKKARYIAKNIEINQEFHFSSSETKLRINDIYISS